MQNAKELCISQIYFPMENLVDHVHGVARVQRGPRQHRQEGATAPCHGAGARARWC
jgi:hypothetical protein